MGAQYILYQQELAKKRALLFAQESEKETEQIEKMREMKRKQERKIQELERRIETNEYLIHVHDEKLKKMRSTSAKVGGTTTTSVGAVARLK